MKEARLIREGDLKGWRNGIRHVFDRWMEMGKGRMEEGDMNVFGGIVD